jgi:hypothetical protein
MMFVHTATKIWSLFLTVCGLGRGRGEQSKVTERLLSLEEKFVQQVWLVQPQTEQVSHSPFYVFGLLQAVC